MEGRQGSRTTTWDDENKNCFERNGVRFLAGVYAVALVALAIAGVTSPDLFIKKSVEMTTNTAGLSSPESTYVFDMTDYKRAHQSIYLSMRLNVPLQLRQAMKFDDTSKYQYMGHFNITVFGSPQETVSSESCESGCVQCPDGDESLGLECDLIADRVVGQDLITCASKDEWCSWLPLYNVDFLWFKTYYFAVETENDLDDYTDPADPDSIEGWIAEFRVMFVSQWYTGFEMAWFYFWCVATLVVMFTPRFGFFASAWMEGVPWRKWSRQQKWVGILLVALLFFDNPFFAAQIFSDYPREFFIWFATAEGILVGLLMMYWLDRLFDIGRGPNEDRSKEGLPLVAQFILTGLIFVTYVVNMIYLRLTREGNPDRVHKYPESSSNGEQVLTILCFVYSVWVIILGVRAYCAVDVKTARRSPRTLFFVMASAVTMIVLLPSVILEHLSPRARGGIAFSMAHGTVNLYILAMAVLCAPRLPHTRPEQAVRAGVDKEAEATRLDQSQADEPSRVSEGVDDARNPSQAEGVEEGSEAPPSRSASFKWGVGRSRPRVADSSMWEDVGVEYTTSS